MKNLIIFLSLSIQSANVLACKVEFNSNDHRIPKLSDRIASIHNQMKKELQELSLRSNESQEEQEVNQGLQQQIQRQGYSEIGLVIEKTFCK